MTLQKPLSHCPYLRVFIDSVPEHLLFVYEYLSNDLLQVGRRGLPTVTRKKILRDALAGLVELHSRNIVHTGL